MSRQNPCGPPPAYVTNVKQTGYMQMKREEARERNVQTEKGQYLAGLKKYRDQGIAIIIDGEELPEKDWNKIFEIREDDSFYMADFVPDGETGKLREIRFDRAYYR